MSFNVNTLNNIIEKEKAKLLKFNEDLGTDSTLLELFHRVRDFKYDYETSKDIDYWTLQNTEKEEITALIESYKLHYKMNPDSEGERGFAIIKDGFYKRNLTAPLFSVIDTLDLTAPLQEQDLVAFAKAYDTYLKWKKKYEIAFNKNIKGKSFVRTPFTTIRRFSELAATSGMSIYKGLTLSPVQSTGINAIFLDNEVINALRVIVSLPSINQYVQLKVSKYTDEHLGQEVISLRIHQMDYLLTAS